MPKTIENKISRILLGVGLMNLGIFAPINACYAAKPQTEQIFDYEKEKLILSNRVMIEQQTKTKWIKYKGNKAVFAADIGTKEKPNYEITTSDANGSSQQIWTHHPFEDRFPIWASDNEIAFERIGKDNKKEIKAYYIINTETGKFKLIKQDEYNKLKEANK